MNLEKKKSLTHGGIQTPDQPVAGHYSDYAILSPFHNWFLINEQNSIQTDDYAPKSAIFPITNPSLVMLDRLVRVHVLPFNPISAQCTGCIHNMAQ
jgi:hypothetical protein